MVPALFIPGSSEARGRSNRCIVDFIHSCKDSANVSNTPAKQRSFALWHSCPAMAAQPGAGVTLFPSLLSTLCFHPPCFIGGLSKSPADTTACLVSRFARDDGASGRQSKISPIPPGLPENSTEARFAAQHTRGCVRVSLLSTRLRSSGGRVQRERPARLARSGEMGPRRVACVTPTWEVGGVHTLGVAHAALIGHRHKNGRMRPLHRSHRASSPFAKA